MKSLKCWKCNMDMNRIMDNFQGFKVNAWQCPKCKDIVYDEADIQPILKYNKLKTAKKVASKVGVLGKSKILRIPKSIEQIYRITKGKRIEFELEPESIKLKISSS
ncbi:hypothetical protein J4448_03140 [Candidatus Woesearchaeota archaeon]|nr:hypothetical protein [Candidatus Woesearchaeota archaeon]